MGDLAAGSDLTLSDSERPIKVIYGQIDQYLKPFSRRKE